MNMKIFKSNVHLQFFCGESAKYGAKYSANFQEN